MPEQPQTETYDGWYLVEQMGHKRLAGYVREVTIAGTGMLRVDVPGTPPVTQFILPTSLYALTPIDEALARRLAVRYRPEPVSRYELRQIEPPRTIEATPGYAVEPDPWTVDPDRYDGEPSNLPDDAPDEEES